MRFSSSEELRKEHLAVVAELVVERVRGMVGNMTSDNRIACAFIIIAFIKKYRMSPIIPNPP